MTVDRSRASECGDKQRHATRAEAGAHRLALIRSGSPSWRIQTYRCRHCDAWHVGHPPRPKKNRR